MVVFWISVALLLLAAYAFFLPALTGRWRRADVDRQKLNMMLYRQRRDDLAKEANPEDATALGAELDKDLLADLAGAETKPETDHPPGYGKASLVMAMIVMPLLAGLAYSQLGRPDLTDFKPEKTAKTQHQQEGGNFEDMIGRLAERLNKDPSNVQGWMLLARSYQETQQYDKAVEAYDKVLAMEPDNLDAKSFYAFSLGQQDGSFGGKPFDIATEVIQARPKDHNALWILGAAAAERGDAKKAESYIRTLRAEFPKDSEDYKNLTNVLAQILGTGPMMVSDDPAPANAASGDKPKKSIKVKVTLALALKKQASADDTVFIFAKAASGPPMPLAIARKKVKDLPLEVTLDDTMAMAPGMNLSSFEQLIIGARVSKTGNALPSPGDLQGMTAPTAVKNGKSYAVEISKTVEAGATQAPMAAAATPASDEPSDDAGNAASADGKTIKVKVSLSDSLKSDAGANDTVFIFAKAASGPPMPLAIVKKQVKDLPLEVTLDDSMAMMPKMNLSSAQQLIIGARVSKSGNAMPAPGDLQGQTEPVAAMSGDKFVVEIGKRVE